MIWVIAGTKDGRELAVDIANKVSDKVLVSVATNYGASLLNNPNIIVLTARLNIDEMKKVITNYKISKIIDASHPYAEVVTKTAYKASVEMGIDYIRYERKLLSLPNYKRMHIVKNEDEAVIKASKLAKQLDDVIFLTIGSKNLAKFIKAKALENKIIYSRVLPTVEVLEICRNLKMSPKNIIAIQGPFSYEMNYYMFKDTKAKIVIMKNSGLVGGADTKLKAAIDLGLDIIVIDRPALPENIKIVNSISEIL